MPEEIRYGTNIIVGVSHNQRWYWYISDKELWFLDLNKFAAAFEQTYSPDVTYRGGIVTVDESTADAFVQAMEKFHVTTEYLRDIVFRKIESLKDFEPEEAIDETLELLPSLMVDFGRKELFSMFAEPMIAFENYAPDGWLGKYESFWNKIPPQERYWIHKGHDLFAKFMEEN